MSHEMEEPEARGPDYEVQHVHSVYEEIASHFSSTRYKVCVSGFMIIGCSLKHLQPWPIVERFLKDQPSGAVGADVGCGNGKYLAVNKEVFIVGSDRCVFFLVPTLTRMLTSNRSRNLVNIAKQHSPHSTIIADNLALPHPQGAFDFAISIAVVHHLSTEARRIEAVKCVLDLLRAPTNSGSQDGGKALIYVWALEQKDSRRGWDEGHEQDVMVPWVLKQKNKSSGENKADEVSNGGEQVTNGDKTYLRYYHLYRKGELDSDIVQAGGIVLEAGYEKDNWWAIASRI